jgi:hypothetical protein
MVEEKTALPPLKVEARVRKAQEGDGYQLTMSRDEFVDCPPPGSSVATKILRLHVVKFIYEEHVHGQGRPPMFLKLAMRFWQIKAALALYERMLREELLLLPKLTKQLADELQDIVKAKAHLDKQQELHDAEQEKTAAEAQAAAAEEPLPTQSEGMQMAALQEALPAPAEDEEMAVVEKVPTAYEKAVEDHQSAKERYDFAVDLFQPFLQDTDPALFGSIRAVVHQVLATALWDLSKVYDLGANNLTFYVKRSLYVNLVRDGIVSADGEVSYPESLRAPIPERWVKDYRATGFTYDTLNDPTLGAVWQC